MHCEIKLYYHIGKWSMSAASLNAGHFRTLNIIAMSFIILTEENDRKNDYHIIKVEL